MKNKRPKEHIRIGLAGLDNSRVMAFAKLLHDTESKDHIDGAVFEAAWPGSPSPDFPMSAARYDRFLDELRDRFRVPILDSLSEVSGRVDAWMLEAVDGRERETLFRQLLAYGKPIFVDKPFSLGSEEAQRMMKLAREADVPVMSCSALRYSQPLIDSFMDDSLGGITGADFYGPMMLEPTQPGYFWYGIHTAEMLFRTLGANCVAVTAKRLGQSDIAVGEWADGRFGMIRGFRTGNEAFGGNIYRVFGTQVIADASAGQSFLATLLEETIHFFRTGQTPIHSYETLAIIRFLEAANESIERGARISL